MQGRGGIKKHKRSSSGNKGVQRKKLETVTLPVTQLTSPDRVKKKKRKEIKEEKWAGARRGTMRV